MNIFNIYIHTYIPYTCCIYMFYLYIYIYMLFTLMLLMQTSPLFLGGVLFWYSSVIPSLCHFKQLSCQIRVQTQLKVDLQKQVAKLMRSWINICYI